MSTTTTRKILEGLSRYRIQGKIGSGGMATVYLAEDQVLLRDVALKIMHEHLLNSPETVRRFTNEAYAVASLSHENIIKVFDYGEIETRPFIVMEHIHGPTLGSLLEQYGAFTNLVAVELGRQILCGLSVAHEKGIFHRDIKPENIMIDRDGTVKIMDFGIAHVVNKESLTLTGSFIGSPRFISPEQAKGESLRGTTDVFSLGVLLYLSLTNDLPFDADIPAAVVHAIIHDTPEPVCIRNKKTLFWFSDFIETCLAKQPMTRPDARTALARLDRDMLYHGLKTGKITLCEYKNDPGRSHDDEQRKLFEHYRQRSREAVKKRQIAVAVKALEQARAFGSVLPEDEKAVKKCLTGRRVTTIALIVIGALFLGGGALFIAYKTAVGKEKGLVRLEHSPVRADAATITPEVPVRQPVFQEDSGKETKPETRVPVPRLHTPRASTTPASAAVRDTSALPQGQHTAWISIRTNPPWAKIYIDGIERGITPSKTNYAVGGGDHSVKIIKDGFKPYQTTCTPAHRETLGVRVHLIPERESNQ
ncbi:MAG: serine/threonine protein kinase [Chitinispirillaceae bacterium]|nr:serine/threonine protein kinase [Chitinispirillaceae bacterium]